MQRRCVLVEICPSQMRAALVVRGRVVASRSVGHWLPDWKESWPKGLVSLAPALRTMLSELGADGLPATIFYAAPHGAAGVYSCPASAGARGAESAARLALADASEFAPEANPTMIFRLAVDHGPRAEGAEGPQIHTLAATDSEAGVRAVTELGTECGLDVRAVAPADTVALASTVRAVLAASKGPGAAVALRIGSWGTVLAAAAGGRLRFVRQISVGTASLVSALTGEVRSTDGAPAPRALDRERAGSLLARSGIPARGSVFDAESGLGADAVLPLMQPVLQRWIVEVRQSLRFGLTEPERAGAHMVPMGPGSQVPNLARLIADQLGLTVAEPDSTPAGPPLGGGSIEDHAAGILGDAELLVPSERAEGRRLATIRRGMWIGIGAACALGAVDGVSAWFELAGARAQQERVKASLADAARVVDIGRSLGDREAAVRASRQKLVGWMSPRARWDALLAVLGRETPASIRLSRVEMRFEGRQPECSIRGHAAASPGSDATASLKSYMEGLSASPIVQKCTLGSARRMQDGDSGRTEFEVVITLVGLPADLDQAMAPLAENRR